jgi:tape measure domain-containing protein
MELRLQRLNLNTLMESGLDYTEAMKGAVEMTKEQMTWVQKLAVTTPYDAQDIANVYTLARSYGFAADAAKGLTSDISDFAAGMGLGNQEIERIIVNFGQMTQQGKVTQRELNDLARGAFVPVNDILRKMQENLEMTDKEFEQFRYTGEGVQAFMVAFSDIVKTRFSGASQDMARTFKGATDNAKDFIKSLLGFGIVTPILDQVGGKIADFIGALTEEGNWERLTSAIGFFSGNLGVVIGDLLGMGPDVSGVADKIITKFQEWGIWIAQNREKISEFFDNIKTKAKDLFDAFKSGDFRGFLEVLGLDTGVLDKIMAFRDKIVGAFDTISAWATENGPVIQRFFESLGKIVGGVFENLTGMEVGGGGGLQEFLDGIIKFMDYVVLNQDGITEFVTQTLKLWGALQLIAFLLPILLAPFVALIGTILSIVGVVVSLIGVLTILLNPLTWIILAAMAFGLIIGMVIGLILRWIESVGGLENAWMIVTQKITDYLLELRDKVSEVLSNWLQTFTDWLTELWSKNVDFWTRIQDTIREKIQASRDAVSETLSEILTAIQDTVDAIVDKFTNTNWGTIGRNIIKGITRGVIHAANELVAAVVDAIQGAMEAAQLALGIQSPSKVFKEYGELMMEGMAIGISNMSGMVQSTMEDAMGEAVLPAMYATAQLGGMVSTQNSYTNNFNLTVNSSSPKEPILQDYNMLQSMAGTP